MAILESQLDTWSHQGSITQSAATYRIIKNALESPGAPYASRSCEVFLQGSYGNDTNIYSESDVDVVICLTASFYHDLSGLSVGERSAFAAAMPDGDYSHDKFRRDVEAILRDAFGSAVQPGPKAIKIAASGGRRNADVIPAFQFRRYHRFISTGDQQFDEGICFFTSSGVRIANYPKDHSTNLTRKHQATNQLFKPSVRILKNLRSRLIADGKLKDGVAPSYFIEGLLYNVPNGCFSGTWQNTLLQSLRWLIDADRSKLVCANNQYYLLGDTAVQWPSANMEAFLAAVIDRWNTG
jgi:hypothetical protein